MKRKRRAVRKRHSPIPKRLSDLREAKGWSQEKVADALGVDKTAVSHWETGDALPDFDRVPAIAELYGTTVIDLIRDEPAWATIQAAMEAA